jgi:hypothetical protein
MTVENQNCYDSKPKLKEVLQSVGSAIVFSPHDWGSHHRDAWIYGIMCGWDEECFPELQEKFGWTDETIQRLKSYHNLVDEIYKGE